jgi:MoaA/NifB/PqqE/SkfB family radical SAM enzyme
MTPRRPSRSRLVWRLLWAVERPGRALRLLVVRLWRRWLIRLYYRHTDHAPPPTTLTLRLTHACNLRCVQCGQWGEKGVFTRPELRPVAPEMSTEDWKRLLDDVSPFCSHVYFFGGEPFLRDDCLALVRAAAAAGMVTGVNTNGMFLGGRGREIAESGMDYLIVSLDGPGDVNNRIRLGRSDVFAAVTAGVRELVEAKRSAGLRYPQVELLMTLTESNAAHIADTARVALELGVDAFALTFGIFTTAELAASSARQFREDFGVAPRFYQGFVRDVTRMEPAAIAAQVAEARRLWGSRYKQYPPVAFTVSDYFRHPERALVSSPCIAPWSVMQVMPNGDVAYCSDFADLVAGNVRAQDPREVWNGPVSRAWRRRIRTRGIYEAETRCCDYYLYQ